MSAPTRRDVLRQLAMAVTAAGSGVFNLEAARLVHAVALEEQQQTGTYALKSLTHHEHATVARLAELIVPADGGGGSAVDAGAPEFIDLLCGQNVELAEIYRGGLAWIDATMRRRSGSTFVDSTPSEQTALLDALVDAEQRGDVDLTGHEEEVVANAMEQDASVEHPDHRRVVAVREQHVAGHPRGHPDEQHFLDAEAAEEPRHGEHEDDF